MLVATVPGDGFQISAQSIGLVFLDPRLMCCRQAMALSNDAVWSMSQLSEADIACIF
jgi:hypothetical protein